MILVTMLELAVIVFPRTQEYGITNVWLGLLIGMVICLTALWLIFCRVCWKSFAEILNERCGLSHVVGIFTGMVLTLTMAAMIHNRFV